LFVLKKVIVSALIAGMVLSFAEGYNPKEVYAATATAVVERTVTFRSAPNTSSTSYGYIRANTNLTVLEVPNKYWIKVQYNGRQGYVSSNYVNMNGTVSNPAPTPIPTAPASTIAKSIIADGEKYMGVPYQYGSKFGENSTFDCSDFVKTIFAENGIYLPRSSRQQYSYSKGVSVSKSELKVGDLVFFSTSSTQYKSGVDRIGHVGVYAGNGMILHTTNNGGVHYESLSTSYRVKHYIGAKRILK
jgi:cell wall-associated NlpC family hydrolase